MERKYTTGTSIYIQDTKTGKWKKEHKGKIAEIRDVVYISYEKFEDLSRSYSFLLDEEGNFNLDTIKDFIEDAKEEKFYGEGGRIIYPVFN